jgi:putative membrane protein
MPSERRLHPLSILFNLGKQAAGFAIPALLFLVGARSRGFGWESMAIVFLVPGAMFAIGRYLTFRYRYERDEMVILSGFVFRNERHVPYARIQNIEAVQNVVHRLFGVVEVRVQTGGADEPEATMSVLSVVAMDEMRRRVAEARGGMTVADAGGDRARVILRLPTRELLLSGFIENRGVLVVGAALGLLWELGLLEGLVEAAVGPRVAGRGTFRAISRAVFAGTLAPGWMLVGAALVAGFLLLTRVLSIGWAFVIFHGFTVFREADDLRVCYGFFTRLTTTVPLRRIQQVTIRETPLHRLFKRASVRVATAGGTGYEGASRQRQWLPPIVHRNDLPRLVEDLLPGVDARLLEWQPVHRRAFRRAVKMSLGLAFATWLLPAVLLRAWSLTLVPGMLVLAVVHARLAVASLAWAKTGNAIAFRRGAFWRYVSIVRFTKIQAVAMHESPFDRRTGMATLSVDTAGASQTDRIEIPYLDRDVVATLGAELAVEAGRTAFRW